MYGYNINSFIKSSRSSMVLTPKRLFHVDAYVVDDVKEYVGLVWEKIYTELGIIDDVNWVTPRIVGKICHF